MTNGTSYDVAIRAVSDAGSGPASSTLTQTPYTYPDAPDPTQITLDNRSNSVVVAWAAPNDNGAAIDSYTATAFSLASAGTSVSSCPTATLTCTIGGLSNGTTYYISVQAHNIAGYSSRSDPRVAATPSTLPGAVSNVTGTAGDGEVSLTWSTGSQGGSAISDYTVWYSSDGTTYTQFADGTSSATAATVTGLTNGTAYTFQVYAVNSFGTSPASTASAAVTPATVPGAPTIDSAMPGNVSVALTWSAPADDGGSSITGYIVRPSVGSPISLGVVTTELVTGLTNGTSYTFTVAAVNAIGTGPDATATAGLVPGTSGGSGGGGAAATKQPPARLAGPERAATAVALSQSAFPLAGSAGAVVLVRSDNYPDALVGTPLAAARNAPLLFASGKELSGDTIAEIQRVLPAGSTVYLLGGAAAIPASVAVQVRALGYVAVRYSGADRYATALAVADALGDPSTILLATGTNFPDALSAGSAAAHVGGAVLLTVGSTMPSAVAAYLAAHPGTVYAVGGPAAAADPSATPLAGADRYATATTVATRLFSLPTEIGVASGETFADALSGGAYEAHFGGVLVLSTATALPDVTDSYLQGIGAGVATSHIFGGTSALSSDVQKALGGALGS